MKFLSLRPIEGGSTLVFISRLSALLSRHQVIMMLSPTNRALLQGGEVTNQVGYEYSGFLIFIKFLGLFSMCASSFIMRDVIHRLRRVTSSTAGGTASWRQKISLTQSIIFCLSIGDFFS